MRVSPIKAESKNITSRGGYISCQVNYCGFGNCANRKAHGESAGDLMNLVRRESPVDKRANKGGGHDTADPEEDA